MSVVSRRFEVPVIAPFSLFFTVRVLQRLPANRVDRWEDGVYRRMIPVGDRYELVTVKQPQEAGSPVLEASARLSPREISVVQAALARLLGTMVDLAPFYAMVRSASPLESLANALEGLKPPRYLSLFEALVNAICGQQVSLTVCVLMVNRLAETCGTRRVAGTEAYHSFPAPAQLTRLNPAEMRGLGLSAAKAAALTELAEGFASGRCSEEEIAALPSPEAIERLQSFTGVGAWSARYALLRGLGRLEQFPSGDVGAARALSELLGGGPLTPTQAESFAQNWKEYAGLMYFHVLGNRYLPEHREQLPLARVPLPLPLP